MPQRRRIQYQVLATTPFGVVEAIAKFESSWHQPWSEPVRFMVDPKRKVAIDSWLYRYVPISDTNESVLYPKWGYAWSEPVRQKPGLGIRYQKVDYQDPAALLRPFTALTWHQWLTEPVRLPIGQKAQLQQDLYWHPRTLPTPNVVLTLAATEPNSDNPEFGMEVYVPPPVIPSQEGASVLITEIPANSNGAASIREP